MGTEFENLNNLCQLVINDLKSTQCSWESLPSRATKLATQLNNTAVCLTNFVDCLQTVSDAANGVKSASKDIGQALTRFCLRQRNLQNDLKVLSNVITENFCGSIEKKGVEWKQKVAEMERKQHKISKRKRNKKEIQSEVLAEQQNFSNELLFGQRELFTSFINTLMPVMKSEIHLLEEGLHIKEVYESIESDILTVNPAFVIKQVIDDSTTNNETAWKKRLPSPSRSTVSSKNSLRQSHNPLPSSSPSTSSFHNWNDDRSSCKSSLPPKKISAVSQQRSLGHEKPPFYKFADNGTNLSMSTALSISANDISFNGLNISQSRIVNDSLSQLNDEITSLYSLGSSVPNSYEPPLPPPPILQRPNSVRMPPPPPERRNSTITAATPTAPSIVDIRAFAASNSSRASFSSNQDDLVSLSSSDAHQHYWPKSSNSNGNDIYSK